ncbi:glycoside hydrolase family 3 C-terminal domain-containing protein [Kutzneria kofuensis]|uniref:glycoside hydrolase family 3 C-terminal domain-containing protein n=1 Tax=Kutzneria kofuensis TaxID=103725 RepID=UPI003CD06EBE
MLLHNKDTLPLAPGSRIAVVGPRADDPHAVMGCYSFPVHVGAHHPDVPLGISVPTVLDALRRDYDVTYALGCPVLGGDDADIAEAVEVARDADCCVVVLGDRTGMFGAGTSGEGCDVADLRLPGRQEELLEAVLGTGKPVVLVLLVGRPYEISRQVDRLAAIVCGFLPGEEGSTALADVLSGRVDPSGPTAGQLPARRRRPAVHLPGADAGPADRGEQRRPDAAVPVRARAQLRARDLAGRRVPARVADRRRVPAVRDPAQRQRRAGDRGRPGVPARSGREVVRPVQQLIAYSRVTLPPGGTTRVDFTLCTPISPATPASGRRQVDPGAVELRIGRSSADISSTLSVNLTGSRRYVGFDRSAAAHLQCDAHRVNERRRVVDRRQHEVSDIPRAG